MAMNDYHIMQYFPKMLRSAFSKFVSFIDARLANMIRLTMGPESTTDYINAMDATDDLRNLVIADWQQRGLDALILPAFACSPLPLGDARKATGATFYSALLGIINFPAGTLPVTEVTHDDVIETETSYPTTDLWHRTIKRGAVGTEGLSVNVQVATLPWQEELCLRVMTEIETLS